MRYNTYYASRIVLPWWLHNHTIRLWQSPSISGLTWICPVAASCGTPCLSCSFGGQCAPLAPFVFPGQHKEPALMFFSTFEPLTLTPNAGT